MKKTRVFYCEAAYFVGLVVLALGCALMEKADFGLSMVVAPAYLIHLKVSEFLPFYTFGTSGYIFQAFLLIALSVALGRFKRYYLLSFVTAVVYGVILDGMIALVSLLALDGMVWRLVYYLLGVPISACGVALLFHTYMIPEAYEVVVKEVSQRFGFAIPKVKTAYDCCSCLVGVALSFAFFGFGVFVGVSWGTVLCALCNGWLIGRFSALMETRFTFKDVLPLRKHI